MPDCKMESCYRYPCFSSMSEQERAYQFGLIDEELSHEDSLANFTSLTNNDWLRVDFENWLRAVALDINGIKKYDFKPMNPIVLEKSEKKIIDKRIKWIEV